MCRSIPLRQILVRTKSLVFVNDFFRRLTVVIVTIQRENRIGILSIKFANFVLFTDVSKENTNDWRNECFSFTLESLNFHRLQNCTTCNLWLYLSFRRISFSLHWKFYWIKKMSIDFHFVLLANWSSEVFRKDFVLTTIVLALFQVLKSSWFELHTTLTDLRSLLLKVRNRPTQYWRILCCDEENMRRPFERIYLLHHVQNR